MIFPNGGVLQLTGFRCIDKTKLQDMQDQSHGCSLLRFPLLYLSAIYEKKNFLQGSYVPLQSSNFRI